MGLIYILTSPNGKQYVGQHKTNNIKKRLESHVSGYKTYIKKSAELEKLRAENPDEKYDGYFPNKGCIALYKAFAKYGPENFDYEVLHIDIPQEQLNDLEDECILNYNTLSPNGYNLRLNCGYVDYNNGSVYSEETRKRQSEAAILRNKTQFEKVRKYKDNLKGLPQHVGFFQSDGYKGYKIFGHPKCSCKYFTSKVESLDVLKNRCLEFLTALENGSYVKEERKLPRGITATKTKNAYMACFKLDGKKYTRYFNDSSDGAENIQNAVNWIANSKAELIKKKSEETNESEESNNKSDEKSEVSKDESQE